jgi:PAS domain S-box-containing protein
MKYSPLARYGVAVVAVGAVLLLKLLLNPLITQQSPFLLMAGAVIVAAWFGGLGPGILATLLGALAADYFFLEPVGSFTGLGVGVLPFTLFVLQGLLISFLVEALRSARRRAEESMEEAQSHQEDLRRSEERLRSLVEDVKDYAIFMLSPEGYVASWNAGAESIMGYRAEEIIGQHVSRFYAREDIRRGKPEQALETAKAQGRSEDEGWRVCKKNGSRFWAHTVTTALRDGTGNLRGFTTVTRDTTERKRAEEALRQSEELYRTVVEQAAENIFLVDTETKRILQANAAFHQLLGYAPEELGEMTLYDIVAHERESIDRNVERIVREGHRYIGERKYRRKDGSLADMEVNASAVSYGGREAMCIVAHDVTERKRMEENLRHSLGVLLALREAGQVLGSTLESEEIVSRLLEIMRGVSNLTAAVISVQDKEENIHIWRSAGLQGLWRRARFAPEAAAARQVALEGGEQQLFRLRHPELESEHLVGLYLPLRSKHRILGVLEAYGPESLAESDMVDILVSLASQATSALENAQLYEKLEEREQRLQNLVGKLLRAQEEERRRVAYEVHDGLAQIAAGAHQHLQAFAERYTPGTEKGRRDLERILRLVRTTVSDARRIIADLRPTTLDDLGLAATISVEVERLREAGYQVDYQEELGDERLPVAAEIALFRVAQEALTNVRKHAQTQQVRIELRRLEDEVCLEVQDYGRGFDPDATPVESGPGERVGLAGMRERITMLGGKLEIHSEPDVGTTVTAAVPLVQAA